MALRCKSVAVSLTLVMLIGCASGGDGSNSGFMGTVKSGAQSSAKAIASAGSAAAGAIKKGASSGAGAVKNLSSGGGSSDSGSEEMFADIARDQVPHTLMRKPVAEGRLSSTYGKRRNPSSWIGFPKFHKGIDYAAPAGTPIYASGSGEVIERRFSSSFGNVMKIQHDNGFVSLYAHLAAFHDGIEVGSRVSRGQQVGAVGNTGRSTGAHLHYELTYKGRHVNPLFTSPPIAASPAS